MQIERKEGLIVITNRTSRIEGAILFLGTIVFALIVLANHGMPSMLALLVWASVVLVGCVMALVPAVEQVSIDQAQRSVSLWRSNFLTRWPERIPASNVMGIETGEDTSEGGPTTYSLYLAEKNGRRRVLTWGLPARPLLLAQQIEQALGIESTAAARL